MDTELIAYLDERFQGIDERFQGIDERFQSIDERFRETAQQIQELRQETSSRFDRVEEAIQRNEQALKRNERLLLETDIKVEALRGDIQQVAEGVAAVDQKLESFRETVALEFGGIRSNTHLYYGNLNRRVRDLELRAPQPES